MRKQDTSLKYEVCQIVSAMWKNKAEKGARVGFTMFIDRLEKVVLRN